MSSALSSGEARRHGDCGRQDLTTQRNILVFAKRVCSCFLSRNAKPGGAGQSSFRREAEAVMYNARYTGLF